MFEKLHPDMSSQNSDLRKFWEVIELFCILFMITQVTAIIKNHRTKYTKKVNFIVLHFKNVKTKIVSDVLILHQANFLMMDELS